MVNQYIEKCGRIQCNDLCVDKDCKENYKYSKMCNKCLNDKCDLSNVNWFNLSSGVETCINNECSKECKEEVENYQQDTFTCPSGTQKVSCINDANKVVCVNENDSTGDKFNEYVTKCDIPYLNNVCRDQKQFNKSVYKALKYAGRRENNRIWVQYGLFHLVCMFIAIYLAMKRPSDNRVSHIILAVLFSPLYILAVGADHILAQTKEE